MKNNRFRWFLFWPIMFFQFIRWYFKSNKLPLPYIYKRKILLSYVKKYNLSCFIETGTCLGDMLYGISNYVEIAYSIEIDNNLYNNVKNRFVKNKHINLILGDSSIHLPLLIKQIRQPVLLYLDAHYSGKGTGKGKIETPLMIELNELFDNPPKDYVVIIDDARHCGKPGYPSYIDIVNLVNKKTNMKISNRDDFIRIEP